MLGTSSWWITMKKKKQKCFGLSSTEWVNFVFYDVYRGPQPPTTRVTTIFKTGVLTFCILNLRPIKKRLVVLSLLKYVFPGNNCVWPAVYIINVGFNDSE